MKIFIVVGIVVIVALLFVLVIVVANTHTDETVELYKATESSAQRRTCQSNIRTVDGAIQAYEAMFDNPVYPSGLEDLVRPETRVLKSIPTCPSGNRPYIWVSGDPPTISCPNKSDHTI